MTREEYAKRFAAHLVGQSGCAEAYATENARAGVDAKEWFAQQAGRSVVWEDPEGAADDEMSYWENDE
jgi:hypothetical protein